MLKTGGSIHEIAGPTWIVIVCGIACLIGVVGRVGQVAIPVGIALKLIISVLHCFIRRLCLDFYVPISIARRRGGCCRSCGNCHDRIARVPVNDVACRSIDLKIGGAGAAGIVVGGVAVQSMVSHVGSGGSGGGDLGTRILTGGIARVSRGRDSSRRIILVLVVLVSSSEQRHVGSNSSIQVFRLIVMEVVAVAVVVLVRYWADREGEKRRVTGYWCRDSGNLNCGHNDVSWLIGRDLLAPPQSRATRTCIYATIDTP